MAKIEKKAWSLQKFKTLYEDNLIEYRVFQRETVWDTTRKSLLIDSILIGFDIPQLYIEVNGDTDEIKYVDDYVVHYIVDGRQRLNAIFEFIENKFPVYQHSEHKFRGKYFKDLTSRERENFLISNMLSVVYYVNYTEDSLLSIFLRLQGGMPLTPSEKRSAFKGNCKNVMHQLSEHPFFENSSKLAFNNKHKDFQDMCTRLFLVSEHQGEVKKISAAELDKVYIDNKDLTSDDVRVKEVIKLLNYLNSMINSEDNLIKFRKSELLTLSHVLVDLFKNTNIHRLKQEVLQAYIKFDVLRKTLDESDVNESNLDFFKYKQYLRADTRDALLFRKNLLKDFIINELGESIIFLSKKRSFSSSDRQIIYNTSDKICDVCNEKVSPEEYDADHIIKHAEGGETVIQNGRVRHVKCNRSDNKVFL